MTHPAKRFVFFFVEAFKDATLLILLIWAAFSLGLGIKQYGVKEGSFEGGSVIIALGLVVLLSAITSFSICDESDERITSLQPRLHKLSSSIGRLGLAAAFLVLLCRLISYFTGKSKDENGNKVFKGSKTDFDHVLKLTAYLGEVIVAISSAAIPKGLSLVVNLTLGFTIRRLRADHQVTVRKRSALETTSLVTVVCADYPGILTSNQMEVKEFCLGQESIQEEGYNGIDSTVRELLYQEAGLNTTNSPTEEAILSWAVQQLGMRLEEVQQRFIILEPAVETFISEGKRTRFSIRKKADNTVHVHSKGDAEMILPICSRYYKKDGITKAMDDDERRTMQYIMDGMAAGGLRCIALAHKQIQDGATQQPLTEDNLTLLGIVGLEDPCRPGIRSAVEICQSAGVGIKIMTGENISTARAIATVCGILPSIADEESGEGEVVKGVEFRNCTQEERMEQYDEMRVLASATLEDKLLMVKALKDNKHHVVAVTGNGFSVANALKEADIRFFMGNCGSEDAKKSSDMIILDDNFATVVAVIRWGRCVYKNMQKFIQLQLTINFAALGINFVAAVVAGKAPLTVVQLVWLNLIMVSLMALALASERPTDWLMKRPPWGGSEPFITNIIWRNLLSQALYQILIILILQFKGGTILNVSPQVIDTMIFNTFVLCQIFNTFNARRLERKNVFRGIQENWFFLGIMGITIILQVLVLEILVKKVGSTNLQGLNSRQWVICIVLAAFTLPIGLIVKFIPVREKPVLLTNSDGELELGFIIKLLWGFVKCFYINDYCVV